MVDSFEKDFLLRWLSGDSGFEELRIERTARNRVPEKKVKLEYGFITGSSESSWNMDLLQGAQNQAGIMYHPEFSFTRPIGTKYL